MERMVRRVGYLYKRNTSGSYSVILIFIIYLDTPCQLSAMKYICVHERTKKIHVTYFIYFICAD